MNGPSLSGQVTTPDQSVAASEQAQPLTDTNVAGSTTVDANAAAGETTNPQAEAIATNFSEATATGDPKTAGASSIGGPYTQKLMDEQAKQFEVQTEIFIKLGVVNPRQRSLYFSSALQGIMLMFSTYPKSFLLEKVKA